MRQAVVVLCDLADEACTSLRIVYLPQLIDKPIIEHLHVHRHRYNIIIIAQCHVLEGKSILSMWTWPSSNPCGFLCNGALIRSACRL